MKFAHLRPVVATAAALGLCLAAHADYKAGVDALAVKDFAHARAEFEADPTNASAIYQLARMATYGMGEPRNETRAAGLFERAAAAGNDTAAVDFAFALGNGRGVAKDTSRAVQLLEGLVAKGHGEGTATLAKALRFGWWGLPKDTTRGAALFKRAMDAGNLEAKTGYGEALVSGDGVAKDEAAGVQLLKDAAEAGEPAAMIELGRLYLRGEAGVPKDMGVSHEWYRKAADKGSRIGQYGVALGYAGGLGVAKDPEAAARWADAAARQGDTWSQLMLADAYNAGNGVPKIRGEAFFWYTVASRGIGTPAERANERRATIARDMKQEEIDAVMRKAEAFQPQFGFRPRPVPLPALAKGDTVVVGNAKIDVPSPRGYANNWQVVDWLQKAHPNDPELRPLLMVLTRQEDIDRVKLGIGGSYRSIEIAEYGADPTVTVTPSIFVDMKKQMRDAMEKGVSNGRFRMDAPARDDDRALVVLRNGIAQGDRVDGVAFVLVKQRVLWLNFTGFRSEHAAELKDLMKAAVDDMLSSNRAFFGG